MGAGAAGLAAARELLAAGHRPVVFEQGGNVGGVWAYSEETEDHPLGLGSKHVHGSMYAGLRTNLPRYGRAGSGRARGRVPGEPATQPPSLHGGLGAQARAPPLPASLSPMAAPPCGSPSPHPHPSRLLAHPPGREVMGFAAFPFDAAFPGSTDPRQFCGHQEVQAYLEAFADRYRLRQHVRLHTAVQHVAPVSASASSSSSSASGGEDGGSGGSGAPPGWARWEVTTRPAQQGQDGQQGQQQQGRQQQQAEASASGGSSTERFDAVVVANGHYSRPRFPSLPGADAFPGLLMHSHNYRRPEGFRGQTVVLVGASSSGVDIAEELARAGAAR